MKKIDAETLQLKIINIRKKLGIDETTVSTELVKIILKFIGKITTKDWNYVNSKTPIPTKCEKGHVSHPIWNNIQRGHYRCPTCAEDLTKLPRGSCISTKHIQKLITYKNGRLDDDFVYVNCRTKFWITCNICNHRWKATSNNINKGSWCPNCNIKSKLKDIKEIKKFIKRKHWFLLSDFEYINSRTKFEVECNKGHIWKTCWATISMKCGCPYCRTLKTEKQFRKCIQNYFQEKFIKCRHSWLRWENNLPLELDGYNKKLKIAFEYQGIQHYELCWFNDFSKKKLCEIQKHDAFKVKRCKEKGILLIAVPYWIPKEKWKSGIKNKYNKLQKDLK